MSKKTANPSAAVLIPKGCRPSPPPKSAARRLLLESEEFTVSGGRNLRPRASGIVGHTVVNAGTPARATDGLLSRITVEPGKCGGRPCIRGHRLRVSDVLDLLAKDASYDEVLAVHPLLERDDIRAALLYAARQADRSAVEVPSRGTGVRRSAARAVAG